jgi:hypothetical protein
MPPPRYPSNLLRPRVWPILQTLLRAGLKRAADLSSGPRGGLRPPSSTFSGAAAHGGCCCKNTHLATSEKTMR